MIYAIVLAAGRSRRMGTQKLLLPFGESTVIGHIVDQIIASPIASLRVVTGTDGGRVTEALAGRGLTFVANPNPDGEMLSSVRCGLLALPEECEAVLVALGDQPAITPALISNMIRAFEASGRGIVVPAHGGKRGHPLLFSRRYAQEVLTHYDEIGLRGLLLAHPGDVLELDVNSAGVLMDLDFPEDYRRLRP
jgi:molybdenum cofactor cytidylyltransferase